MIVMCQSKDTCHSPATGALVGDCDHYSGTALCDFHRDWESCGHCERSGFAEWLTVEEYLERIN